MIKLLIIFISIFLFLAACKNNTKQENEKQIIKREDTVGIKNSIGNSENKTNLIAKSGSAQINSPKDSILLQLTQDILTAIKSKNYFAVANFIDPILGVRFSPYAYVDTVDNVIFSKEKLAQQSKLVKQDKIVWGVIDPTRESINMTLNDYMQKFVYDVDFIKPEKRSVNKFIGGGNSLNNLKLIYKNCDFTESYFSGFEEKYEGMDWRSLRLVFKERQGRFLLVGIVHDKWTI
jgi:hypothetical protein